MHTAHRLTNESRLCYKRTSDKTFCCRRLLMDALRNWLRPTYESIKHDSCIWETWLIRTGHVTSTHWLALILAQPHIWEYETWLIHEEDMTRLNNTWRLLMNSLRNWARPTYESTKYDSFIQETWLIYTKDMTQLYGGHGTFIRDTWRLLMDSLRYWLRPTYGVATINRLLKITGLFCKRAL